MIRYLTLKQVLVQQRMVINGTGGKHGFKNINGVDSAVAQPQMTFDGEELYPTIPEGCRFGVLAHQKSRLFRWEQANRIQRYAGFSQTKWF